MFGFNFVRNKSLEEIKEASFSILQALKGKDYYPEDYSANSDQVLVRFSNPSGF